MTETGVVEINECTTPYSIMVDGVKFHVTCSHGAARHVAPGTLSEVGKPIPTRCLVPACPCEKLQGRAGDVLDSNL